MHQQKKVGYSLFEQAILKVLVLFQENYIALLRSLLLE
jgi:hypothetical protein